MSLAAISLLLVDAGLNPSGVAGILANIDVETGGTFDYKQVEVGGDGYGLFQLDPSGPLPTAYAEYRAGRLDSAMLQVNFMLDTIYGDRQDVIGRGNARILREVIEEGTAVEVAVEFSNRWERPSIPHLERRKEAALKYCNKVNK